MTVSSSSTVTTKPRIEEMRRNAIQGKHLQLELMTARREQLLRIPGIGPVGADAILKARRLGKLTTLTGLQKLGIRAPEQTSPSILLNGKRPVAQLRLF